MKLTPEQEVLKTFAVRAVGGDPWYAVDDLLLIEKRELRFLVQDANYIAFAKPALILALLAQVEAAQEALADALTLDLVALVRRLSRQLSVSHPGLTLPEEATGFLIRKGLIGSPLRGARNKLGADASPPGSERKGGEP